MDIDEDVYLDIYADFRVKVNDPEKEKIKVTWDFGDGRKSYKNETRHKYDKKGKYEVAVKIFDGSEEIIKKKKIEVKKYPERKMKIISVVPNPSGNDTENEYIIVKNQSRKKVNLKGWSIATGSKKLYNHPILKDLIVDSGDTVKITRRYSKFSLNNKKAKIELRYSNGERADKVKYDLGSRSASDDAVYEKVDSEWKWTGAQKDTEIYSQNNAETMQNGADFETQINADMKSPINVEETTKEDFEEFSGGQSEDLSGKERQKELVSYSTSIKLASWSSNGREKVLGAETIKEEGNNYYFTDSHYQEEHYAVKFFKKLTAEINYFIGKTISAFLN